MRILHVTDTFLPRLGGIELHVADLASRQRAAGHEVLVLTGEQAVADADATIEVPVTRVHLGPIGAGAGVAVGPVVAAFEPDVVHAHLTVGSPFTWAMLRGCKGVPVLATLHSLLPAAPWLVRAGIRVTGIPVSRMSFTAVSEVAAARLRPALPAGVPVRVLHNGVDPSAWQVAHRPTGEFSILSVGRLAARKRPLVLINALARFAAGSPDLAWHATLVGDGAQRRQVAAAIRAHGLDERVTLTGAQSRDAVREHLARADVLVAPATLESFGIAALEARCAGVPIVAMGTSGVTEFISDGIDGLLADTDEEIAGCLARLGSDAVFRESVRRHNATTPVAMTWDRVLGEHDAAYRSVLERGAVRL
jgi:glycosyltransferase involved in cell wall biosynthesis